MAYPEIQQVTQAIEKARNQQTEGRTAEFYNLAIALINQCTIDLIQLAEVLIPLGLTDAYN
jgi:hypothetical protein